MVVCCQWVRGAVADAGEQNAGVAAVGSEEGGGG